MNALRQLVAGLWAALWLRGRLLGLRLRRLFRSRSDADGTNFQLIGDDVRGVEAERDLTELPAELFARLAVTRGELVERARAVATPRPTRRRRRAAALTITAVLGLGAIGAGASALVSGSTGVPAVDRLLGIFEQGLSKPGAADRLGPSGSDLQPSPSKASEPIETTLPDGSRNVTTFYVARDGKICWAVATLAEDTAGGLSCESSKVVADGVRDGGYVSGMALGRIYVALTGYVSGDVVSLSGRGPSGPLEVQLGESWTPSSNPALGSLKPFVAVAYLDSPPRLDTPDQAPELQRRSYTFDAVTDQDRQLRISP